MLSFNNFLLVFILLAVFVVYYEMVLSSSNLEKISRKIDLLYMTNLELHKELYEKTYDTQVNTSPNLVFDTSKFFSVQDYKQDVQQQLTEITEEESKSVTQEAPPVVEKEVQNTNRGITSEKLEAFI
jgi:hypothetical protein